MLLTGPGWRFVVTGPDGRRRPNRPLAVVIFLFPALCFLFALLTAAVSLAYLSGADRVQGTVVHLYEWPGETIMDRGRINYEPVFTFTDATGREWRASVGSGHTSFNLPVGTRHDIWWNPAIDGNVRLATWEGLWFVPAVLAVLAAVTLPVSILLWQGLCRLVGRGNRV